jgi:hypothetical protein
LCTLTPLWLSLRTRCAFYGSHASPPASTVAPAACTHPSASLHGWTTTPTRAPRFLGPWLSWCACRTVFGFHAPHPLPRALALPVPAHQRLRMVGPLCPHVHPDSWVYGCPSAPAAPLLVPVLLSISTRAPAACTRPSASPWGRPTMPTCSPRFAGLWLTWCARCTVFGSPAPPPLQRVLPLPVPAHRCLRAIDPLRPHVHPIFEVPGYPRTLAAPDLVFPPSPLPHTLPPPALTNRHLPALCRVCPHVHRVFQISGGPRAPIALGFIFLPPSISTLALAVGTCLSTPP